MILTACQGFDELVVSCNHYEGAYSRRAALERCSGLYRPCTRLMIGFFMDVNEDDKQDALVILHWCSFSVHTISLQELAEMLATNPAAVGHNAVVLFLLETGADVNARSGECGNALQGASSQGHEAIVELLLEKTVNVNGRGESSSIRRSRESRSDATR